MSVVFAAIAPHPPIILPSVGSTEDRTRVKNTISALEKLGERLKEIDHDSIIISSPHPGWGIEVPLYFLSSKIKNSEDVKISRIAEKDSLRDRKLKIQNYQTVSDIIIKQSDDFTVYPLLTTLDTPAQHLEWGEELYLQIKNLKSKFALIASGDLSHCLKEDGPYGFNQDGPKFDRALIEALNKKDIETILKLDDLYPEAGECGLRSFCFILGIMKASGLWWQPEILSYEGTFGVGYLVANFKL